MAYMKICRILTEAKQWNELPFCGTSFSCTVLTTRHFTFSYLFPYMGGTVLPEAHVALTISVVVSYI
jgi:hypothetical protein